MLALPSKFYDDMGVVGMEQLTLLRATAQRLSTTPVEDLPRIAGFLASSISSCGLVLQEPPSKSVDSTVPLHKLHTRLSSLLQDKTPAGRFTAAVVIKSYVENATPNSSQWESWARGLISCLNKQDPWEAKKIYLSTIVRIFMLCQHSASLQREVSTPLLTPFITASLAIVKPHTKKTGSQIRITTSPVLPHVLHAWDELLQEHGNTLRPFVARIKPICLSILSKSSHQPHLQDLAARILSSLHRCAPKNSALAEWNSTFTSLIDLSHNTLDLLFRGVLEDWTLHSTIRLRSSSRHEYAKPPEVVERDAAGLWPWKGIHEGVLRVMNLFRWALKMLDCTRQPAAVPVGSLLDLIARIFAVSVPTGSDMSQYPLRLNADVDKVEREELWANLPGLHLIGLRMCRVLVKNLGLVTFPAFVPIGNQVLELFEVEKWHPTIRAASYDFMSCLLHSSATLCSQLSRSSLTGLCKSCCQDVASVYDSSTRSNSSNGDAKHGGAKGVLKSSQPSDTQSITLAAASPLPPIVESAQTLLVALLDHAPAMVLSSSLRAEMDRIAILSANKDAIYASVINPPPTRTGQRALPSLIPFLTRLSSGTGLDVEVLIRPRLPVFNDLATPVGTGLEMEVEESDKMPGADLDGFHEQQKQVNGDLHHWAGTVPSVKQTVSEDAQPTSLEQPAAEVEVAKKRDFAAMQNAEQSLSADSVLQSSKKVRAEGLQKVAEFERSAALLEESSDNGPRLIKASEGITTNFTAPSSESSAKAASAALRDESQPDDDSDDSKIPSINGELLIDLEGDDEDDENIGE